MNSANAASYLLVLQLYWWSTSITMCVCASVDTAQFGVIL